MKFQPILEWEVKVQLLSNKYGAVPVAITYDEIEFYIERPVQTFEDDKKLAIEQYAFCYGLLWECYDTLEELASAI